MQWFHISVALGLSISEAQRQISSTEFIEYQAYFQLHPPISVRADINSALIRQTIIASQAQKKSDIPKFENLLIDYENNYRMTQAEEKEKEIWGRMQQYAARHNLKYKDK